MSARKKIVLIADEHAIEVNGHPRAEVGRIAENYTRILRAVAGTMGLKDFEIILASTLHATPLREQV